MTYAATRELINTHVQAIAGLPPVQLENTPNIGKTGQAFTRVTVAPLRATELTMGLTGQDLVRGVVRIDLFFPQNKGTAEAAALADTVVAAFPRGLYLADADVLLNFGPPSVDVGAIVEPFYILPILVEYSSARTT